MKRIPLLDGPEAPDAVTRTLTLFGKNPYGEPIYRLIWSTRKQLWFAGEIVLEYDDRDACWILERWLSPEEDAGPEALWGKLQEALAGPYPRRGTYMFAQQFGVADEESLRLYCVATEKSLGLARKQREDAIRAKLQEKEAKHILNVAEQIVELADSGSSGKSQQSVSGPKNTFRTTEDFERDQWKVDHVANLPKRGGKLI